MKSKIFVLLLLFYGLVGLGCGGGAQEKAIDYNNAIVDIDFFVGKHFGFFVHLVEEGGDSAKVMKAFDAAIDSARVGLKKVEAIQDFKGSTSLRDAAKGLLQFYVKALDVEYRSILPILLDTNSTIEAIDRVGVILAKSRQEEDSLYTLLEAQQKAFAKEYKFELDQ